METNDGPKWIHRLGSARAGCQNARVTDLAASADQFARRAELYERFAVVPVAFSINGRQVGFVGPLDAGITVGGIAVVEHDDGLVAVHVHDVQLETRQGTREIGADDDEVTVGFAMRHVRGTGVVIGVLGDDGLTVADQLAAFGERRVRAATDDEVGRIMAALDGDAATITIGTIRGFPGLPARLRSKGFARHTFMCGQSGSGKTYTTGVLFERLLAHSSLPMMIIDPNSDHVHLGTLADPGDTSPEVERYRQVAPSVVVSRTRGLPSTRSPISTTTPRSAPSPIGWTRRTRSSTWRTWPRTIRRRHGSLVGSRTSASTSGASGAGTASTRSPRST